MSDYTELERRAKAATGIEDVSVAPDVLLELIAENKSAHKHWQNESNNLQVAVGEVSRITAERNQAEQDYKDVVGTIELRDIEIATLRAEVAGLKTGYEAYERVNAELKAECEAIKAEIAHARNEIDGLRKGWYSDDGDNIRFWPEEMEVLRSENGELLKAITEINDALEREYWSEYAGLDDTRAILDAAMGKGERS